MLGLYVMTSSKTFPIWSSHSVNKYILSHHHMAPLIEVFVALEWLHCHYNVTAFRLKLVFLDWTSENMLIWNSPLPERIFRSFCRHIYWRHNKTTARAGWLASRSTTTLPRFSVVDQQLTKTAGISMLKRISDQRNVLLQTKTNEADR